MSAATEEEEEEEDGVEVVVVVGSGAPKKLEGQAEDALPDWARKR